MIFALRLSDLCNYPRGGSLWLYWSRHRRGSAPVVLLKNMLASFICFNFFFSSWPHERHPSGKCFTFQLVSQQNRTGKSLSGQFQLQPSVWNVLFLTRKTGSSISELFLRGYEPKSIFFPPCFVSVSWQFCGRSKSSSRASKALKSEPDHPPKSPTLLNPRFDASQTDPEDVFYWILICSQRALRCWRLRHWARFVLHKFQIDSGRVKTHSHPAPQNNRNKK